MKPAVRLPSGTVTFLFTDIEGSTRRWESDPDAMRSALSRHDAALRTAIERRSGVLFKHTGDGVCAVFERADDAVCAAVEAQLTLELPVRMGMATGEANAEGADYFGPILNRAARVMSAGHGGQILVAASTVECTSAGSEPGDVSFVDLGSRRLRDLSEAVQIFQVAANGLGTDFPALKTVDAVPGNLPAQATSFLGRETELADLDAAIRSHRLVTLTGVGGVGKTRLAIQTAAKLTPHFPDGVWLVELAPIGDPAAIAYTVASTLGVTPQAGRKITDQLGDALSGRQILLVIDNCEHVLDAVATLLDRVLAMASEVTILATSREALRIGPEHTWPVPTLDVHEGADSTAVTLFVARAREARPDFVIDDTTLDAITEICTRLDGIALAIELAAARMVSMSAVEVRDRLDDRFRLLSGGTRGRERHQTLREAVKWSFDLLDDDERTALVSCSVFADGFDLAAAATICMIDDEYAVLDLVDSLVRRSLVIAETASGSSRYRMLETIRQFCADEMAAAGVLTEVHGRHAQYFGSQTLARWEIWDGPRQREVLDWVDTEFDNLRAAFRWSTAQRDLVTATAVAAHVGIMIWPLQQFEPVAWAEEILADAVAADLPQLPRLYVAASLCLYGGRPDVGVDYAQRAAELERDTRYDPFVDGWSDLLEALSHLFGGRIERRVEICTAMAARDGFARVVGHCGLTWALPAVGRADEATALAEPTVEIAREYGSPFWIGWALGGFGRAYARVDPERALGALREGLGYAHDHRLPFWEANLAQDAAPLEATHGDLGDALELFSRSIDSFHRAGNVAFLAATLASLAVFFDRFERPEVAATIYGASTRQASIGLVPDLDDAVTHMRATLGADLFVGRVDVGTEMAIIDAVRYAHAAISAADATLVRR